MRKIVRFATEITQKGEKVKERKENKMVEEEIGSSSYPLSMILCTREDTQEI